MANPATDEPKTPEPIQAAKSRRGALSALGMVTGVNVHAALFSRFFGPAMASIKSRWRNLLGEVFKSAEVLGNKFFPKASTHRLGPISAGGLLVLLLGFGPCLFFVGRAVLRVAHMVERFQERSTHDLAEARKVREATRAHAAAQAAPVSSPSSSQEKKP
jgi:hypothetical protein